MQTLTVASPKGGSAKTSISASLAVEASQNVKRVALVDLDPQQSLAMWHGLRVQKVGADAGPELIPMGSRIGLALDKVQAQPSPPDLVIVDCPPGSIHLTRRGIEAANFVLVPMKASPLDAETANVVAELCREYDKPFAFVLTMVMPSWKTMAAGARDFLKEVGPVLDAEITHRQAYVQAMLGGRTGAERDKTAAAEIAALWQAVKKRLASKKGQAR
jgi:chromosome partitioning protein